MEMSHSPRESGASNSLGSGPFPVGQRGRDSRLTITRPPPSSHNRGNVEYFQDYDRWASDVANYYCFSLPGVQMIGRVLQGLAELMRKGCNFYYHSHSSTCHGITCFCFLSCVIALVIADAMQSRIAAFTIPAVHHKWSLDEKIRGCRNAALYYAILGIAVLVLSWLRSSSVRLRAYWSGKTPTKERRRTLLRRKPRRTSVDSDESELHSVASPTDHPSLHNRSGYLSSGYSSSGPADEVRSPFELGISGRLSKDRLRLLGLGSPSGTEE